MRKAKQQQVDADKRELERDINLVRETPPDEIEVGLLGSFVAQPARQCSVRSCWDLASGRPAMGWVWRGAVRDSVRVTAAQPASTGPAFVSSSMRQAAGAVCILCKRLIKHAYSETAASSARGLLACQAISASVWELCA